EMNTRLQVEHPVTEMISGFDLVEWQLRVAAGQPLPVKQADIVLTGHAIEARLYAEDPYSGFAPQTGPIRWWRPERAVYEGVRIDDGIREGGEVTPFYDAMVAKLIVHGRDRDDAIRRLMATLDDAPLLGLRNNARFLRDLVDHPTFRKGEMTTTLIDKWLDDQEPIMQRPVASPESVWVAAAVHARRDMARVAGDRLRSASVTGYDLKLSADGVAHAMRVIPGTGGAVRILPKGEADSVEVRIVSHEAGDKGGELRYEINGVRKRILAVWAEGSLHVVIDAATFVFTEVSPWPSQDQANDPRRALSPVAGVIAQVLVKAGDVVEAGQQLVSVEAMKMEMWLCAQAPGVVKAVSGSTGDQVQAGALIVELELNETEAKES
ncbi:MAG: biotin/lipoyl-binding protein, partial [Burkholderiales bacterium]|nr:biotin/lipoyl-binding protein [Burkholderiales bacterium]